MHARQAIRDKVRTLLEADATIAGGGWAVRDDLIDLAEVAQEASRRMLLVFVLGDRDVEMQLVSPRVYVRRADVVVEILTDLAPGEAKVPDKLDDICEVVEQALLARENRTLDGLVGDLRYQGTTVDYSGEGVFETAGALVRFEADFYTNQSAQLTDATGVDVDYDLSPDPPDAEDTIDLPTT